MRTEDIVNRIFTRSFMGYDIEQVDRFLDEVIDALEQYEAEKKEMLTAMEYLLQKLETGSQLPVAEMREAIDSGRPAAKKRAKLPERTKDVRIPSKRADRSAAGQQQEQSETKAAARSITRGGGNGAPKPVRAPKVSRVATPQPETKNEKATEPPTATKREDWLDELLVSLSERDRHAYTTTEPHAAHPAVPAEEVTATTAPQAPKQTETPARTETPEPKTQAAPQAADTRPAPEAAKAQPTIRTTGANQAPMPPTPVQKQTKPSTDEAIRSFEETLRTLGGQFRPEAGAQAADSRRAEGGEDESGAHLPKHAAAPEEKEQ